MHREFWTDLLGFVGKFVQHHDLAKDQDEQHKLSTRDLKRGEVGLGIDAAEGHLHRHRREHQSAYYNQLLSNLWVVVLFIRVEDLANITEEERARLLELFAKEGKPPIVRETHFYVTPYKEKGQTIVQHILRDIMQGYLDGTGRWAAARDGAEDDEDDEAPAGYWESARLTAEETEERSYYEGRAAASEQGTFKRLFAFSDGAGCQFMCATFLLFLSAITGKSCQISSVFAWN